MSSSMITDAMMQKAQELFFQSYCTEVYVSTDNQGWYNKGDADLYALHHAGVNIFCITSDMVKEWEPVQDKLKRQAAQLAIDKQYFPIFKAGYDFGVNASKDL